MSFRPINFLLCIALLLQMASPSGFMPSFGPDGFTISICSGSSSKSAFVSAEDPDYQLLALVHGIDLENESEKHDSAEIANGCSFGGADNVALAAAEKKETIQDTRSSDDIHDLYDLVKSRHFAQTPPATGPPLLLS